MIVVLSLSFFLLSTSFSHVPVLYLFVLLFHRLEACLLLRQSERNVSGIRLQLSSFRTFNSRIYELCRTSNDTGWSVSFRSHPCGRCPTVSMLDAGRVIVFLGTTLLPEPLSTYEDKWLTVNPPGSLIKKRGGVAMLLVASLYRNWDELWPDEPFDLLGNFTWHVNRLWEYWLPPFRDPFTWIRMCNWPVFHPTRLGTKSGAGREVRVTHEFFL